MKFDHTKHNIEELAYYLRVLGNSISMSDDQILKHFKESFPPKIYSQLLEIDGTDSAISRQVFGTSSLLAHMTDHVPHNNKKINFSKPGTFDEAFCKTGIDPERLTRETMTLNLSLVTAEEDMHQTFRGSLANRHSFSKRGLKEEITLICPK